MAKSRASVGMSMASDELISTINELDRLVKFKVVDKALKAAARPVLSRMRANTPSSGASGSRKKQSAKVRARFSNSRPLKTAIRSVVRRYERGGISLVGPSYTHGGGHGNFFARDHKQKVLWGKPTGDIRKVNQFVKATADETAGAARTAMIATIKEEIDKAAREASRGTSRG